jgi:hypothetical protein
LARWREAIEVGERKAVHRGVADLDYAAESGHSFFVDLVSAKKIRIVKEITQKPSEFPDSLGRAIEASRNRSADKFDRFDYGESEEVEGLLSVPSVVDAIHADEEHAVWHVTFRLG